MKCIPLKPRLYSNIGVVRGIQFSLFLIQNIDCGYLRNEFHFSGVHGAMNRSGSRAK